MNKPPGAGGVIFAAVLLMVGGVLNVIYGIAAIDKSSFFANSTKFIVSDLKTWGWVTLILGILELAAFLSLLRGGAFGRWFGISLGSLNAIGALLSIPAYPLWSIAVFALSLWIIYGLAVYPGAGVERATSEKTAAEGAGAGSVTITPGR
jgi:hypothetical protein